MTWKEILAWTFAVLFAALLIVLMCRSMDSSNRAMAEASERAKREAFEYAQKGWVYRCGWDCHWERIPGFESGKGK